MTAPNTDDSGRNGISSAAGAATANDSRPVALSENEPVAPDNVTDVFERTNLLLGALQLSGRLPDTRDAGRSLSTPRRRRRRRHAVEEEKESNERQETEVRSTGTSTTTSTRTSTDIVDSPNHTAVSEHGNELEQADMTPPIYGHLLDEADQQRRRPMRRRGTADVQESTRASAGTTSGASAPSSIDLPLLALAPQVSESHISVFYQALLEQVDEIEQAEHRRERRTTSARGV